MTNNSSAEKFQLVGFYNPTKSLPSFIFPVFQKLPHGNAFYIQNIDERELVEEFEQLDVPGEAITIIDSDITSSIGGNPVWGFQFTDREYHLGHDEDTKAYLNERLNDNTLTNAPLVHLEVIEFVERFDLLGEVLKRAYSMMRRISASAADYWRDSVVLTPIFRDIVKRIVSMGPKPPQLPTKWTSAIRFEIDKEGRPIVWVPHELFEFIGFPTRTEVLRKDAAKFLSGFGFNPDQLGINTKIPAPSDAQSRLPIPNAFVKELDTGQAESANRPRFLLSGITVRSFKTIHSLSLPGNLRESISILPRLFQSLELEAGKDWPLFILVVDEELTRHDVVEEIRRAAQRRAPTHLIWLCSKPLNFDKNFERSMRLRLPITLIPKQITSAPDGTNPISYQRLLLRFFQCLFAHYLLTDSTSKDRWHKYWGEFSIFSAGVSKSREHPASSGLQRALIHSLASGFSINQAEEVYVVGHNMDGMSKSDAASFDAWLHNHLLFQSGLFSNIKNAQFGYLPGARQPTTVSVLARRLLLKPSLDDFRLALRWIFSALNWKVSSSRKGNVKKLSAGKFFVSAGLLADDNTRQHRMNGGPKILLDTSLKATPEYIGELLKRDAFVIQLSRLPLLEDARSKWQIQFAVLSQLHASEIREFIIKPLSKALKSEFFERHNATDLMGRIQITPETATVHGIEITSIHSKRERRFDRISFSGHFVGKFWWKGNNRKHRRSMPHELTGSFKAAATANGIEVLNMDVSW